MFRPSRGFMLFWLPAIMLNVLSQFAFYKLAERMDMNPILVSLAFYRVTEVERPQSGGSDDFVTYDFSMGTMQGSAAEKNAQF